MMGGYMSKDIFLCLLKEKHNGNFEKYVDFCLDNSYGGDEYSEKHHILVRSSFPEFEKESWNVVRLKYSDHIEAHTLLAEACPIRKFVRPLNFMLAEQEEYKARYKDICIENWNLFRSSPQYNIWLANRKKYCREVFVKGGSRYDHILKMTQLGNTQEAKRKKSESCKSFWTDEIREEWGKLVSSRYDDPEYKAKCAKATSDAWKNMDPERYAELCQNRKQRNNDPEILRKNSEGVKLAYQDTKVKERHRRGLIGKLWWNDGISQTKSKDCPGPNWVRGRIPGQMKAIVAKREHNRKSK